MAPRKRSTDGDGEEAVATAASTRVTRSSSRKINGGAVAAPPPTEPKKRSSKKAKTAASGGEEGGEEVAPVDDVADAGSRTRIIVIEHCKQCNAFKTRAVQVKNGLENGVPGITVLLNPEKPRRGCFEIREQGGEKFITLLGMVRPFKPMKDLDMDKVISDIIEKIK